MAAARTLLCLGECMVELSDAGDGTYRRGFAGDTFNAAWYARRALGDGWRVAYGSCLGEDAISDEMAGFIAGEGIAADTLRRVSGRTVGLYMISLTHGERAFSYWRGNSAARLLAQDADWLAGVLNGAAHVHLSGITCAILPPAGRDTLRAALARARAAGTTVSFDTNLRPALWEDRATMQREVMATAAVSDILLPSFDEETALFGDATPADTIARYRAQGARQVVVKNGGGPVVLWSQGAEPVSLPVAPVARVVDTTAAGDSFAGTFLAATLDGAAPDEAVRSAARCAAEVIQVRGALMR
ncbi:sugar kinase [Mesobaculum littorinae]|uniref:Sugar kinase n=1 Tax=Mesobaculum littorinae TaxID=2486419 RepID=A0A438AI05_9RHOB|nr:sugar kinase [Mesobaculum littorinae]RVV98288.1 sugar kinase [Mesobaculum littorinae]